VVDEESARGFFSTLEKATEFLQESQKPNHPVSQATIAARHLGAEQFWSVILPLRDSPHGFMEEVAQIIDARTTLSLLAAEKSQDYERFIAPWAFSLSEYLNDAQEPSIAGFLSLEASQKALAPVPKLLRQLEVQISDLKYGDSTERIRLVLGLAALELERLADTDQKLLPLSRFTSTDFHDIEHITPESFAKKGLVSVDVSEKIHSIGNLTLWSWDQNRRSQDRKPAQKGSEYFRFSLLITRTLAIETIQNAKILENSRSIARESENLDQLRSWNQDSIRRRTALYFQLIAGYYSRVLGANPL
jgi:hypothetical protein